MSEITTPFSEAMRLHRQGQLKQAAVLYQKVLAAEPRHAPALHMLGLTRLQENNVEEGIALIRRSLSLAADPLACNNLGRALLGAQRYGEALPVLETAVRLNPDSPDSQTLLGNALLGLGQLAPALARYDRALVLNPDSVGALYNRGRALLALGRGDGALADFDRALARAATLAEAHLGRGNALLHLGNARAAIDAFQEAIRQNAGLAEAHAGLGAAWLQLKEPDRALASFDHALQFAPGSPDARNGRGGALLQLQQPGAALECFEAALALAPASPEALANKATALADLGRESEALECYAAALAARPHFPEALANQAEALRKLKRHPEAARSVRLLLQQAPEADHALGDLVRSLQMTCDWHDWPELTSRLADSVQQGHPLVRPFTFLSAVDSPALQLQCARQHAARLVPSTPSALWQGERYAHDRIRVAYLSADFHNHATAYLMAQLFEKHDRNRFELTALSFGPDRPDEMRRRIQGSFDRFEDVRSLGNRGIAVRLRELEIDIAVDLKGYTQDSRPQVFAYRPAPVQVNYLGFPGTMGAPFMDYLVADRHIIPEQSRQWYEEKIVYLPESYQPNDATRVIAGNTLSRAEAGLPESGFVFCCFNSLYKVTPEMFAIWMRLLHSVPGSVLWLLQDSAEAVASLRREATACGVESHRLVFAHRARPPDHLARHRLADLFLDTLPVNAHTTASDALWAGLPVLTVQGEAFAGRVASSLLHAVGLPDLATRTLADYEALARTLALEPSRLSELRQALAQNRATAPLFDAVRLCRHLESAFVAMWERQQAGLPPAGFSVAPLR